MHVALDISNSSTQFEPLRRPKAEVQAIKPEKISKSIYFGDVSIIEVILSGGADRNILDGLGRTPLVLASLHGHASAVNRLIGRGK